MQRVAKLSDHPSGSITTRCLLPGWLVSRSIDSTVWDVERGQVVESLLNGHVHLDNTHHFPPKWQQNRANITVPGSDIVLSGANYELCIHQESSKKIKNLALKSDYGWVRNMERFLFYYIPAHNLSLHIVSEFSVPNLVVGDWMGLVTIIDATPVLQTRGISLSEDGTRGCLTDSK